MRVPQQRVEEGRSRLELLCLAEPVELAVLGQEGKPVRDNHARAEMIKKVFSGESPLGAVTLKQL
jgi:hypothetical protein